MVTDDLGGLSPSKASIRIWKKVHEYVVKNFHYSLQRNWRYLFLHAEVQRCMWYSCYLYHAIALSCSHCYLYYLHNPITVPFLSVTCVICIIQSLVLYLVFSVNCVICIMQSVYLVRLSTIFTEVFIKLNLAWSSIYPEEIRWLIISNDTVPHISEGTLEKGKGIYLESRHPWQHAFFRHYSGHIILLCHMTLIWLNSTMLYPIFVPSLFLAHHIQYLCWNFFLLDLNPGYITHRAILIRCPYSHNAPMNGIISVNGPWIRGRWWEGRSKQISSNADCETDGVRRNKRRAAKITCLNCKLWMKNMRVISILY